MAEDIIRKYLYSWDGFNEKAFLAINSFHNKDYDKIFATITGLGDGRMFYPYVVIFLIARAVYIWKYPDGRSSTASTPKYKGFLVLLLMFAGNLFSMKAIPFFKAYFGYPRPYVILKQAHQVLAMANSESYHSFPSGHAFFSMMIFGALWPVLNKTGKIIVGIAVFLVGLSRIILGMHFPADVLAGWIFAAVVMYVLRKLLSFLLAQTEQGLKLAK